MGFEENGFDLDKYRADRERGPSMAEVWAKEDAQQKAEEQRMIDDAKADAAAVWLLADYLMPADFKEMARSMQMETTMQEMWRNAFIAGWRAQHRQPK